MPISRRQFLVGGASALVLAACSGDDDKDAAPASTSTTTTTTAVRVPTTEAPAAPLAAPPFTLGVASGDPDTTSVVLWTRLAPAEGDQPVVWEVATDEAFETLVAAGAVTAVPDDAHSVHVVADGLDPDTWYWYRFRAGEHTSPVARTRTAPEGDTEGLRFAFASCQSWTDGYYTAHAGLAKEDVDLVVWLGDYIYEGGLDPRAVRNHDGPEPMTLDAYRNRYALYKSDPHLQAAHARAPWFVIWDDHEVENNYAGDSSQDHVPVAAFNARRAAAYKAWWEHQPTRLPKPDGSSLVTYRALPWGSLVTFFALDGRQYRDDQPCGRESDLGAGCAERDDPARTMLGAEQEAWLGEELPASAATWNVLAQQTIFSPSGIPIGDSEIFNLDQWDGYPAARDRLLDVLAKTANPVIITGDIHASAVADFKLGDAIVGTELVGTSITSQFPEALIDIFEAAAASSGAKMADARRRGYVVCEVTTDELTAHYRVVESITTETSPVTTSSSWVISAGTPGVRPLA